MKAMVRSLLSAALIGAAAAGRASAICIASSSVFGSATAVSPTTWLYQFSVQNGCALGAQPLMTDFFLPYFGDAGVSDITLPPPDVTSLQGAVTWTATVEPSNNLFNLLNAGVIDFHVTVTPEFEVLPGQREPGVGYYFATGFSFMADFGPVKGPFAIQQTPYDGGDYIGTTYVFGDPPIPGSPETIAALAATTTPEPATLTLLATGLLSMIVVGLRRRSA